MCHYNRQHLISMNELFGGQTCFYYFEKKKNDENYPAVEWFPSKICLYSIKFKRWKVLKFIIFAGNYCQNIIFAITKYTCTYLITNVYEWLVYNVDDYWYVYIYIWCDMYIYIYILAVLAAWRKYNIKSYMKCLMPDGRSFCYSHNPPNFLGEVYGRG